MTTTPIKVSGAFSQLIHEESATALERVGTVRILQDGRKFRYSKAGAGALGAGKLAVAADVAANVTNVSPAADAAIGLAILVTFFRNKGSVAVEDISAMKG